MKFVMESRKEIFKRHIIKCFEDAEKNESKLSKVYGGSEILQIEGMTGEKTRHLYNNLLNFHDARYLEIGTWTGSSVCSAMFNNKATIVCVDNWSEFDGRNVRLKFFNNIEQFKGQNTLRFIEDDCFVINTKDLPKFNIYLYDGGHRYEDHFRALSHFVNCLDDIFIFIVDDWNWSWIRRATFDSIKANRLKIIWKHEIILTKNDEHTPEIESRETWWNGIGVFLLENSNGKRIKLFDKIFTMISESVRKF